MVGLIQKNYYLYWLVRFDMKDIEMYPGHFLDLLCHDARGGPHC